MNTQTTMAEWGTLDYYIDRLSSPNAPIHVDVCDPSLTDDDAIRLADALTATQNGGKGGTTLKKLRLRGSQITSRGFLALAEAIGGVEGSTSALEELDFGHTIQITDDIDDFAFGMYLLLSAAKHLKCLDLEGNYIGRREEIAVGEVFGAHGMIIKRCWKC